MSRVLSRTNRSSILIKVAEIPGVPATTRSSLHAQRPTQNVIYSELRKIDVHISSTGGFHDSLVCWSELRNVPNSAVSPVIRSQHLRVRHDVWKPQTWRKTPTKPLEPVESQVFSPLESGGRRRSLRRSRSHPEVSRSRRLLRLLLSRIKKFKFQKG